MTREKTPSKKSLTNFFRWQKSVTAIPISSCRSLDRASRKPLSELLRPPGAENIDSSFFAATLPQQQLFQTTRARLPRGSGTTAGDGGCSRRCPNGGTSGRSCAPPAGTRRRARRQAPSAAEPLAPRRSPAPTAACRRSAPVRHGRGSGGRGACALRAARPLAATAAVTSCPCAHPAPGSAAAALAGQGRIKWSSGRGESARPLPGRGLRAAVARRSARRFLPLPPAAFGARCHLPPSRPSLPAAGAWRPGGLSRPRLRGARSAPFPHARPGPARRAAGGAVPLSVARELRGGGGERRGAASAAEGREGGPAGGREGRAAGARRGGRSAGGGGRARGWSGPGRAGAAGPCAPGEPLRTMEGPIAGGRRGAGCAAFALSQGSAPRS